MHCWRFILILILSPALLHAGEFIYVKKPTRAETKETSRSAIEASFGVNRFKQSRWSYIGPFDNQGGQGVKRAYPPEQQIDLTAEYPGAFGKPIRWQDGSRFRDGDDIDLRIFDIYDMTVCYLYRMIESDQDQLANLSVGSDDCIAIWLNGIKAHEYQGIRGVKIDEDIVPVLLKKGTNKLLMKISNFATGYGFAYRISTLDRAGLDQLNLALKKLDDQLDLDFPNPETDYYRLANITTPRELVPEIGGLAYLPDGRIMLCTRRGEVWSWRPGTDQWNLFAAGLHEPLGMLVVSTNEILVTQRPELTRLKDTDGDGKADLFETMTDSFGLSGNFHEFHFGPVRDAAGNLYATLNCGWNGFAVSDVPLRGWAYQLTAEGRFVPYALGFRSPSGIGMSPDGEIFVTDSQGDWWGTSPLIHLQPGKFYGHPDSLKWANGYQGPPKPHNIPPAQLEPLKTLPALWFPYGNLSRSPSEMVWDTTGGKFGPFTGQMLVADQPQSAVVRVALEKVAGEYQGAVFPFRSGFESGVVRLLMTPAGTLYAGQTQRGWSAIGAKEFGLQQLNWTGRLPMEILTVKLTTNGFDLTFTKPVDPLTAANRAAWSLQHFHYHYYIHYGSPKVDVTSVPVREVRVSVDRRTVSLVVPELVTKKIYELRVSGLKADDGTELLHPEAYYTLNRLVPTLVP